MRSTRSRLLVAAALPLMLLTACGESGQDASPSSSSSSPASPLTVKPEQITPMTAAAVSQTNPAKPTVKLTKTPFQVNATTTKVVKQGTGKKVGAKDIAYVSYVAVNGTSGKTIESTFGKPNAAFNLGNPGTFPGLVTALKKATVGSELMVAVPPAEGFGGTGEPQLGITSKDTMVFFVKVNSSMPILTEVKGTPQQWGAGKPSATVPAGAGKEAKITFPKGAKPPTTTMSHELIKGTGPKVVAGQTVLVSYTGQIWNGKVFDSTAKQGGQPATFQLQTGQGGVVPGFVKGIAGHPVGSRVIVSMTPADGYGKTGNAQAGIKGTDTLVFVIDILAAI